MVSSPVSNPASAAWLSLTARAPSRLGWADDRTTAAAALARARRGETLVYRGDYRNARQLLGAMGRRLDRGRPARGGLREAYLLERRRRAEAHELLARLAVPLEDGAGGARVSLARAPDVAEAVRQALGDRVALPGLLPLRDLLGMVGAHQWRRRGVEVPALGGRVHPWYGVFAPVRGEHVELVAEAARRWPPAGRAALDVGTGTGVLAFVLARAGARVTATDLSAAAVGCARENAARLRLPVEVVQADLFTGGPFDLVVANPPWLPGEPAGPLDAAIYDPGGAFLSRLLAGLPGSLAEGGEAWLVLSDLAERLGLRRPGEVEGAIAAAGLAVVDAIPARPSHPRALDPGDPLHLARRSEVTTLRRLRRA
jgi:SAM-dependent methyltransferase